MNKTLSLFKRKSIENANNLTELQLMVIGVSGSKEDYKKIVKTGGETASTVEERKVTGIEVSKRQSRNKVIGSYEE
jgi:hypothetical protein